MPAEAYGSSLVCGPTDLVRHMNTEVGRLIRESRFTSSNKRQHVRHAFVYPVVIYQHTRAEGLAFSRDLSAGGIGLIQARPIDTGTVANLEIRATGAPVFVRSEVRWCRAYGSGWHLTGWQFITLSDLHLVSLAANQPQ